MTLRTLDDLGDVAGKRVFVRVDFNVPLDGGAVADDARIRAALPTVTELLDDGASLVLASHLGRPKGQVKDELRLAPVAGRLQELLGRPVVALGEPAPASLPDDPVILLENLRFDPGRGGERPDLRRAARRARRTPMSTTPSGRRTARTRASRPCPS